MKMLKEMVIGALAVASAWSANAALDLAGSGTVEDPYRIGSVDDLQAWVAGMGTKYTNDACYKVTADITIDADTAAKLLPLYPNSDNRFAGTFDGDNHKITYTLAATQEWTAFIAYSQNATFRNVVIDGTITATGSTKCYCGIFVGYAYGHSLFENITTEGSITGSKLKNVAGVCVRSQTMTNNVNTIVFNYCTNKADMATTYSKAAGIYCYSSGVWAHTDKTISFTGCRNEGNVTCLGGAGASGAWAGGIAGWIEYQESVALTNCSNVGAISGTQDNCKTGNNDLIAVGGMIGNTSNPIIMTGCTNSGTITGAGKAITGDPQNGGIGGLVGVTGWTLINITDCSNTGVVQYGNGEGTVDVSSCTTLASFIGRNSRKNVTRAGTVSAQDSMAPMGFNCAAYSFATVADGVATFCDAVAGGSYKVMLGGQTVTLANEGDTITLDMTLASATVTTTAENCEVTQNGNVYTVVPKTKSVNPGDSVEVTADSKDAAEALVNPQVPDAVADEIAEAGMTDEYLSYFKSTATSAGDNKWNVKVELKAEVAEAITNALTTMESTIIATVTDSTATTAKLTTKPGLFYAIVTQDSVDGMQSATPADDDWVLAEGEELEFTLDKSGDKKFYKTACSVDKGKSN